MHYDLLYHAAECDVEETAQVHGIPVDELSTLVEELHAARAAYGHNAQLLHYAQALYASLTAH